MKKIKLYKQFGIENPLEERLNGTIPSKNSEEDQKESDKEQNANPKTSSYIDRQYRC